MQKPRLKKGTSELSRSHIYRQLVDAGVKYVDLGWRKFTIHLTDDLKDPAGREADGLTDFSDYKIVLNSNLPDLRARETLLHEIMHCLFDTFDLDERNEASVTVKNESLTAMTTRGFLLIKNLNPRLWSLLY